jgi:hypothetical protein
VVVDSSVFVFNLVDDSGVILIDQVSPFLKSTFKDEPVIVGVDLAGRRSCEILEDSLETYFPVSKISVIDASSHCVSHACASKSAAQTIPRSASKFVFTPSMLVSSRAGFALEIMPFQVGAVIMIFASKLSKLVLTTVLYLT